MRTEHTDGQTMQRPTPPPGAFSGQSYLDFATNILFSSSWVQVNIWRKSGRNSLKVFVRFTENQKWEGQTKECLWPRLSHKKNKVALEQRSQLIRLLWADFITPRGGNHPEVFSRDERWTVYEEEERNWVGGVSMESWKTCQSVSLLHIPQTLLPSYEVFRQ